MFLELINIEKAEKLLDNWDEWADKTEWKSSGYKTKKNQKVYLKKIIEKSKNNGWTDYLFTDKKDYGRKYANSNSLQGIKRKIRNTICEEYYDDLDMVRSQSKIACWWAKNNGLPINFIEDYTESQSEMYSILKQHKGLINKIMFGGAIHNTNSPEINNWFVNFQNQMKTIGNYILGMETNDPDIKQIVSSVKKAKENRWGKCLANVLQKYESDILEKVFIFLDGKGIPLKHFVKIFDGFLIPKEYHSQHLLVDINEHIFNTLGIPVEFIHKPFDEIVDTSKMEINELADDQINANTILECFDKMIYRTSSGLFIYDEMNGKWSNNKDEHFRILETNSHKFAIKSKKSFFMIYENAMKLIRVKAPENLNFFNDADIGFLLFTNGVLDMANYKMLDFNCDYHFTKGINRKFETKEYDHNELKETMFDTMFSDDSKKNYFLFILARAIGGNWTDRQTAMLIGNTACGKSTLIRLIMNCFESYIGTFLMENMIKKKNQSNESERDNAWLCNIYNCRISFSSELKLQVENGKITKIDGNMMKKATGGDPIRARDVYQTTIQFIVKSFIFAVMNDVCEIDPADDAMISRLNIFMADRQSKKGISEMDDLYFPAKSPEIIEKYINDPDTLNQFIQLLCKHYVLPVEKPDCVKKDTTESSGADELSKVWITQRYELDTNGFISYKQVYQEFLGSGNTMSKIKFTKWLKSMGFLTDNKTINRITEMYILGFKNKMVDEF
jgi:ABC-type oligopeptide transport system ATPase subunit